MGKIPLYKIGVLVNSIPDGIRYMSNFLDASVLLERPMRKSKETFVSVNPGVQILFESRSRGPQNKAFHQNNNNQNQLIHQ